MLASPSRPLRLLRPLRWLRTIGPGYGRRLGTLTGVLGVALLLATCQGEYPQSTIDPVTDFGRSIQSLYTSIFWWTMFVLAVVWGTLAYVLIRFRERPDQPHPKQIHGHLGLEIAWTIVPAVIVVAIAIPSVQVVFRTQAPVAADAMVVEVIGHRYWWEFRYPESGVTTANELHLPVGRPVSLKMNSADVIHSFWVPMLGGKRDVNPLVRLPEGREPKYNWLYFTPGETGVFMGQCAEFCGESHALMGIRVIVDDPDAFDAWIADWQTPAPTSIVGIVGQAPGQEDQAPGQEDPAPGQEGAAAPVPQSPQQALIVQGREVFNGGSFCLACHAVQGTPAMGVLGPNLTRLGGRRTLAAGLLEMSEENLFRWIVDPQSVKPGALMPGQKNGGGGFPAHELSDDQVRAVAAYLYSLR